MRPSVSRIAALPLSTRTTARWVLTTHRGSRLALSSRVRRGLAAGINTADSLTGVRTRLAGRALLRDVQAGPAYATGARPPARGPTDARRGGGPWPPPLRASCATSG